MPLLPLAKQCEIALATELISTVPFDKLKLAYFYAPLYACRIATAVQQVDQALSSCNHYIDMMERGGHLLGLPNYQYQKSVILQAQGDWEGAVSILYQALNRAKMQQARMILWRDRSVSEYQSRIQLTSQNNGQDAGRYRR